MRKYENREGGCEIAEGGRGVVGGGVGIKVFGGQSKREKMGRGIGQDEDNDLVFR